MRNWHLVLFYVSMVGIGVLIVRTRVRYGAERPHPSGAPTQEIREAELKKAFREIAKEKTPPKEPSQPKPDGRRWHADEYHVVRSSPGVLAIKHRGTTLFAPFHKLAVKSCDKAKLCVRFPNGQEIIANKDVGDRLPSGLFHEFVPAARPLPVKP